MAAPTVNDAPTNGWDTVFAVTDDELSEAIVRRSSSPRALNRKPSGPLQFGLTAAFADWKVVPGGDGGIVNFALPMTGMVGTYVLKGQPGTVTCDDLVATIAIRLSVAPHIGPAYGVDGKLLPDAAAGTTRHALTPRTVSNDPADPVASMVGIVFNAPLSDPQADGVVKQAILDWANDNLAEFEHIFAFVDLNDQIATGQWAFCKPHTMSYAYVDRTDRKSGFLAVLCMTSTDPVPSIQQVNGFAIPPGCGAGFLISPRRFLADMVQPSLLQLWPNLRGSNLEIASDDTVLRMKPGVTVALPDTKGSDGRTYTPVMSSFELAISGTEIQIDMHTEVEVSKGIYGTCTSTTWYTIALGTNGKGEQTLVYTRSRTPVDTKGSYSSSGAQIIGILLKALAVGFALLSIVVTDGAGIVVAAALFICLAGDFALNEIADAARTDAPGLDDLTATFIGPVVWTDKDFVLTTGGLTTSLQLGGTWT